MTYAYTTKMAEFIPWYLEEQPRPQYWEDLYSEYISLRENKSSLYVLGLIKEITFLKAKYQIVQKACEMLTLCFKHVLLEEAAELKATLRLYNFRQTFDLKDEALFTRDVRAVLSANKKTITTWQRKEEELKNFQEKHQAGPGWDRKAFNVWAITLGQHLSYRVDLGVTTVAEWCTMLNAYEKYCEVINAQQKGKTYGQRK